MILLLVALCMAAHTVKNLSSFLFAATAVSALLAVTSILWNVLLPCLLNWSTSNTNTVSSQLMKTSVIFSFRTDYLLHCLFHSVASVLSRMFFKLNKSKNFTPGYIMVLHTFGRDLKWNPHIHCLISEGGYSDDGFWRHITHFNYTYLRNAFRTALLNEMESRLASSFKKVKALCYSQHKQGFYVYAKPIANLLNNAISLQR